MIVILILPGLLDPSIIFFNSHWHAHTAQIVGRGLLQRVNGTDVLPSLDDIEAGIVNSTNLELPPSRDVAMAQARGWVTIRFIANNPGAWCM